MEWELEYEMTRADMFGCLRTRVRKQPIIALYFEYEID